MMTATPMKSAFSLTLLLSILLLLPLSAYAETIEGKLNGLQCAISGYVCPIDKKDPMVALEADFVVQTGPEEWYLIPNIDRAIKARYVLEDVVVTGQVDPQYRSINADTLQVKQNGTLKTVWSQQEQEQMRKQFQEQIYKGSQ